jgi:hypothetical protein
VKTTIMLVGALALLAVTGVANAAYLMAGPLYPQAPDGIRCWAVNISSVPRPVTIQAIGPSGQLLFQTGPAVVGPGQVLGAFGVGADGPVYCKFIGALPTTFRAAIGGFGIIDSSDFVALPAR